MSMSDWRNHIAILWAEITTPTPPTVTDTPAADDTKENG